MEFFRVNDNMIKCIISEADMDEYDVSIEDFFTRSENAIEFLRVIVEQAAEEVGYKPQGPLTSLQITPVDQRGLAIFLPETPQLELSNFLKNLQKGAGIKIPDDVMDMVESASDEDRMSMFEKFMNNIHKEIEKGFVRENSVPPKKEGPSFKEVFDQAVRTDKDGTRRIVSLDRKIFAFTKLSDIMDYAKAVELPVEIGSSLYKDTDHDTYYLIVDRNEAEAGTLAGVYLTAYEYGHFVSEKAEQALFIKEHCQCLIEENAIGKLKGAI